MNTLRERVTNMLSNFHCFDSLGVDLRATIFDHLLRTAYNECCPIKQKSYSQSRLAKPWIDDDIIRMCSTKHLLFRLYRCGDICFDEYNSFKNRVTAVLKFTKKQYFTNKFNECRSNMKDTWKTIKTLLNNKKARTVDKINYNGVTITDSTSVANIFNTHFSSVGVNLRNKIPVIDVCPLSYLGYRCLSIELLGCHHGTLVP